MSGIVGIHYLEDRQVEPKAILAMLEVLAHRGSNNVDLWCRGNIGLGHRMLWTTPESLIEKLPATNLAKDLAITADARIDNRAELIPLLDLNKYPSETITDSQIILAAYEKWGEACPEKLLGDFAFAIWHQKQQKLFCARDHMGVKPFYYYYQSTLGFLFASEIKALLVQPQVPRRLNEVRLGDYLALSLEDRVITTYQDILRLPPAHTLTVSEQGIKIRSYWKLDPKREIKLSSDAEYAEAFREIFTEAVRCRLRSAFPIGSHLSGGVDSSAVTCVARDILAQEAKQQLHTFSNIFDAVTECDERHYINQVLKSGDLMPHYIHPDRFQPFSNLPQFWQYEDEALTGPSYFYPWLLSQSARQAEVKVMLTGFDGDNVVCHGVPRLGELARQGKWDTFMTEVSAVSQHFGVSVKSLVEYYGLAHLKHPYKNRRWLSTLQDINQIHQAFGFSRKQLLSNYLLKPLLAKLVKSNQSAESSAVDLLEQNFAKRIDLEARIKKFAHLAQASEMTVREYHYQNLTSGILTFILEQMDRCHAAFGIESRHPFMDKRLIEFCLALPSEQKLHQGWGRVVLRRALAGILPQEIQWRSGKTSMTPNFLHTTLNLDGQLLQKLTQESSLKQLDSYLNTQCFIDAYQKMISEQKVRERDNLIVWRVAVLALWLDHTKLLP
ncbi:MAG TPA: lasso peptide isopeptide bond-forming cyclase [Xenococcaceae cyanobacterium]